MNMTTVRLAVFAALWLSTPIHGFAPIRSPQNQVGKTRNLNRPVFATVDFPAEKSETKESSIASPKVRPLHQNWWPVTLLNSLDKSRPNPIELLGSRLVLFWDDGPNEWKCLDDKCAHRFAPLSEGRVLPAQDNSCKAACLQCAYHGWEFSGDGKCTHLPQGAKETEEKVKPVPSYPVRVDVGMVWVWADPDKASLPLANSLQLPIDSLLRRHHEYHGDGACFMRDLPYGMELLGENLLDLSHLPFSHHSVGGLSRESGGPLPLRMMSEEHKEEFESWDDSFEGSPLLQASLVDAGHHDPVFMGLRNAMGDDAIDEDAQCVIGFYEPAHVRYRRVRKKGQASHTELFMCPTHPGKSRVFLFNVASSLLPSPNNQEKKKNFVSSLSKLRHPKKFLASLQLYIFRKMMNPSRVTSHLFSHKIFDGDGIFLHKQGNRMSQFGLTFRDYETPSSADVLLNAFRRYLEGAAKATQNAGKDAAARCVVPPKDTYRDTDPRSVLLDRYMSHTANCAVCSAALEKYKRRKRRCDAILAGLVGATGASLSLALSTALAVVRRGIADASIFPLQNLVTTALSCMLGIVWTSKRRARLERKIQELCFVDYVHARVD